MPSRRRTTALVTSTTLLLLAPATATTSGLAAWIESAKDYLAVSNVATPELRATRTCASITLDWVPLPDAGHLYALERRPDRALNWKWTALSVEEAASPLLYFNDTKIDNSREYTYRLHVRTPGQVPSEFVYAVAAPSSSCMNWSELAAATVHSLRIRVDTVVATTARIACLLLGIHLVLLVVRSYLGLAPDARHHLRRLPSTSPPPPTTELRRRKANSDVSCSSTENESDMDTPRLSQSNASSNAQLTASHASSAMASVTSLRDSEAKEARCHGCRKKFGLFRKRRVCATCRMMLCRPCGIARTSPSVKQYICLPCRADAAA
ncbi:hypothetical protein SDRG_08423 [Saprolegnia diclina VS20]|uniref:FYVE-type domain-containing protein n=1 Tax=Saprolegnia diclina (strain VS20) TaxID=1156394 RepID=T0QHJ6_SAPDV|nr:hypothetical protein SDRG_08423 [Saprolegnia diclina VS20]EQC34221.1 hypothetical protein SDRG_08423 [Saprolegnia diclina VS20]|eukprot:XP_008612533.1 hypothetical protein SDRG_08423 [Saprolegnia diclina VS20]